MRRIVNAKVVTPNRVLENGLVSIEGDIICTRCESVWVEDGKHGGFLEFLSLRVGHTPQGLQIWCLRCDTNGQVAIKGRLPDLSADSPSPDYDFATLLNQYAI